MGLKNPIGETIKWNTEWEKGGNFKILGVVRDMVMESPFMPAYPTIFLLHGDMNCIFVKIKLILLENHNIMSAKALGETYKLRRKDLRITQPQLAELAEVSVNTLYKLERGTGNPTLDTLIKVADILGFELTLKVKGINPVP